MKLTVWMLLLASVAGLSGCAAALVYDRDRPAGDCRSTPEHRCISGSAPANREDHEATGPVAVRIYPSLAAL